jgi:hypothetical protein
MQDIVVLDIPVVENNIQVVDFNSIASNLNKSEIRSFIKDIETKMMTEGEHIEIPVNHHFSKDVYAREMVVPKGTMLVGKIHKHQNLNILSQGEVSILSIDGSLRVKAPYTFVGSPGSKRLFYMHEDTVWTTIHGTNETNVDKIEESFIAKNYEDVYLASKRTFNDVISILGFSEQELLDISENKADMLYLHSSTDKFEIKSSDIHGKGLFAKVEIKKNEIIGPARLHNMRTEIGKYSNHSDTPNAKMIKNEIGDIDLVAIEDIEINKEITTDYFYNYTVSRENLCLG